MELAHDATDSLELMLRTQVGADDEVGTYGEPSVIEGDDRSALRLIPPESSQYGPLLPHQLIAKPFGHSNSSVLGSRSA